MLSKHMTCVCGEPLIGKQTRFCSKQCNTNTAVSKWRKTLKQRAIDYKGGCCYRCGYDKYNGALQFHHTDHTKEFSISGGGNTRSWVRVKKELDKCVLVCANCHAEAHEEERNALVAPT